MRMEKKKIKLIHRDIIIKIIVVVKIDESEQ